MVSAMAIAVFVTLPRRSPPARNSNVSATPAGAKDNAIDDHAGPEARTESAPETVGPALARRWQIRGSVRFQDGTTVPHASVVVQDPEGTPWVMVTADDKGEFLASLWRQGPCTVVASAPRCLVWAHREVVLGDSGAEVDVMLPVPCSLLATVSGDQGEPLAADISVQLPAFCGEISTLPKGLRFKAGPDGLAQIEGLPEISDENPIRYKNLAHNRLIIWASFEGYFPLAADVPVRPGVNRLAITLKRAPPDLLLAGWIERPDGSPAGHVVVEFKAFTCASTSHGLGECETDAEGHFAFSVKGASLRYHDDGRVMEFVRIFAASPTTAATFLDLRGLEAGRARTDIRLMLDAGTLLEGVVLDQDRKPLPDSTVEVFGDEPERANDFGLQVFQCDRDGHYRAFLPSSGRIVVQADAGNAVPAEDEPGFPSARYLLVERPSRLDFRLIRYGE